MRARAEPSCTGVLSASALRVRLGVGSAADQAAVAADARPARSGFPEDADSGLGGLGGLGGLSLADLGGAGGFGAGEPASDDEATAAGGETLGRGDSSSSLEQSGAFVEPL